MKTIHSLNTQRSVEVGENPGHSYQQQAQEHRTLEQSEVQSQREFSFCRQLRSHSESTLKDKYYEIYNDLKIMSPADVIELLLEELDDNEKCKKELFVCSHRMQGLEQELATTREALKKKREAIGLLCEAESKNLQLIEKLENKLSKKGEYSRDTHYEKKYLQLSIYMNEYIRNINLAQEEFRKTYTALKAQNQRLLQQVEKANEQVSKAARKQQLMAQRVRKYEEEISELGQIKSKLCCNLHIATQQNSILKKEIELFQENIRITDRLEVHIEKENHQLSSELDFIREKIYENQNISRDLIEKLEESSSNCDRVNKDKDKFYESLQKSKERCTNLEKDVTTLRTRNQQLEQDLAILKKQYEYVVRERDELDDEILQEKLEKESIRKELLTLAEKVRLMESTYRKQIQQNEMIKDELYRFWENKQKKQGPSTAHSPSLRVLSESKMQNNENSQTTMSISEKQSKLSLWQRKSDCEGSTNAQEKENQAEHHYSRDSLCD